MSGHRLTEELFTDLLELRKPHFPLCQGSTALSVFGFICQDHLKKVHLCHMHQVSLWCPPSPPPSGMFDYASINVKFGSGAFGKLADTRHRHGLEKAPRVGGGKKEKEKTAG
ncbi:hypothetical protein QQF64_025810 [Cirrhinus molitorella]|uniref:Uncharacterized protein n=1 Tax=Cirrhinus molitorella TaxID=172907 RepID=A0ABR3NQ20_9TELE